MWANDWTRAAWLRSPRFALTLVTPADGTVISIDDAKAHLNFPADDPNEDPNVNINVTNWIRAAMRKVEVDAEVSLLTQTWDAVVDHFPYDTSPMLIPLRPLQSITYVKYTNSLGTQFTVDPTTYLLDPASRRLGLLGLNVWPGDLRTFQPIVMRIVAGWTDPALVPDTLVQAVRLLVGTFSENRQMTTTETGLYDFLISPESLHTFA